MLPVNILSAGWVGLCTVFILVMDSSRSSWMAEFSL